MKYLELVGFEFLPFWSIEISILVSEKLRKKYGKKKNLKS